MQSREKLVTTAAIAAASVSLAFSWLNEHQAVAVQRAPQTTTAPDEAMRLADAIKGLPAWPTCNNFSPKDWNLYVSVARRMQELPKDNLARALSEFGERLPWGEGDRLMILLRVVFDVPDDISGDDVPRYVAACGGIPAHPPTRGKREIGEPVWWTGERFVLTAYQSISGGTTGPGGAFYYPLAEYNYFSARFPLRNLKLSN